MRQTVTVSEVKENGMAVIRLRRASACGHSCEGCGGCGAPNVTILAEALNPVHARLGDRVVVESRNKTLLGAAAAVYLAPIALFFLFYAGGHLAFEKGAVCGIAGFAAGLLLAALFNRRLTRKGGVTFTIVAIEERA